jgi:hypothetical protein
MISAEVPRYAGQTWPCYGVQPIGWGQTTRFLPFVHDGRVVHWGWAYDDQSAAMAEAARMAAETEPRQ